MEVEEIKHDDQENVLDNEETNFSLFKWLAFITILGLFLSMGDESLYSIGQSTLNHVSGFTKGLILISMLTCWLPDLVGSLIFLLSFLVLIEMVADIFSTRIFNKWFKPAGFCCMLYILMSFDNIVCLLIGMFGFLIGGILLAKGGAEVELKNRKDEDWVIRRLGKGMKVLGWTIVVSTAAIFLLSSCLLFLDNNVLVTLLIQVCNSADFIALSLAILYMVKPLAFSTLSTARKVVIALGIITIVGTGFALSESGLDIDSN